MRLDIFLKLSRLASQRLAAQTLCDGGKVSVNHTPAKPSKTVHQGDEIEIRRYGRTILARVLAIPAKRQVSRSEAGTLIEVLKETQNDDPF
jgi:ribosomal 50S subunit-recycling heat shock protein